MYNTNISWKLEVPYLVLYLHMTHDPRNTLEVTSDSCCWHQGVVHRDVKLENVLVASQKRAYAGGPLLYTVACQIYLQRAKNLGELCLILQYFLQYPWCLGYFW